MRIAARLSTRGTRMKTARCNDKEVFILSQQVEPEHSGAVEASTQQHPAGATLPLPFPPGSRCVYGEQTLALQWLREDFVNQLLPAMRAMLRGALHVRLSGASVLSRAEFAASVETNSCCYCMQWDGPSGSIQSVYMEMTASIAFPIINCLMGGSSDDAFIPRRPLTAIERRVLSRTMDVIAQSLQAVLPGLDAQAQLTIQPIELPPQAQGDELVVSATFELALDRQAGMLRLCLDAQSAPAVASPVDQPGRKDSPLEVSAVLVQTPVEAADLAGLEIGDILTTDSPAGGEVILRVAGIPKFIGRLGVCNGHRAVTILRRI